MSSSATLRFVIDARSNVDREERLRCGHPAPGCDGATNRTTTVPGLDSAHLHTYETAPGGRAGTDCPRADRRGQLGDRGRALRGLRVRSRR